MLQELQVVAHSAEVTHSVPHVGERRLQVLSDGRLRWGLSVTFAVLLHVAAIGALVATMHVTPRSEPAATDIEVALVDPVDKPDDPQPPAKPLEEAPPPAAEATPPPEPAAQPVPNVPVPAPPARADPPIARAEPQPPQDKPPLLPNAPPAPPGNPSPTRADADSSQPKAEATPPAAEYGFSIPIGPRESASPEPAQPPATVAARPTVPQPAPAAQVTRMAPLVVVAGAQHDPRLPSYPIDAQARGEQGNVLVEVALDPGGAIRGARIKTSSGHASLDAAALRSAQSLRFRPPRPPPGVVLRHTIQVEIPFSYRLQ